MLRALAVSLSLVLAASPALAVEGRDLDTGAPMVADGSAINIVVTVVHAKPIPGGVAPELSKLEHYLLKAFPTYQSFKRLSTQTQRLAVGKEGRVTLPNDNQLVIEHTGWKSE
mgnify:CR=1 FL=1